MMDNFFHTFDGNYWTTHGDMITARTVATAALNEARRACNPEWPSHAGDIAIYAAPAASDAPDEDGELLMRTGEIDNQAAPDGSGMDYFCDLVLVFVPAHGEHREYWGRDFDAWLSWQSNITYDQPYTYLVALYAKDADWHRRSVQKPYPSKR